jgi:hypothetical protein
MRTEEGNAMDFPELNSESPGTSVAFFALSAAADNLAVVLFVRRDNLG